MQHVGRLIPGTASLSRRGLLAGGLAGLAVANRTAAAAVPPLRTAVPGSLTVAMNGDMPMDSVQDGKLVGTDGEMVAAIAQKLGLKAAPALMDWSAALESARSGRADLVIGNMGWSPQRGQTLLMTDAIYYMGRYMLMRQSAPFKSSMTIAEMSGHSVGAISGGLAVPELKKVPGLTEVKLYDTTDSCARDIRAGRLDLGILDGPTILYMVRQNADWGLKVALLEPAAGYSLLGRKQATSIGMDPRNPDLFDAMNSGIKWLWESGRTREILQKYGLDNPDNLTPIDPDPRIGADRDPSGGLTGTLAHQRKDFSTAFASSPP